MLAGTGGRDASRLYRLGDGRQLVLPLVRERSLPGLGRYADFPGGYGHGGMLATGGLRADDVRLVVEDLRGLGLTTRIGGAHHTAEQWSAAIGPGVAELPRRVEVIDLERGFDALVAEGFSRTTRQSVRKAERAGVEVERDTTGRLVPVFHDLYLAWVERWIPRPGLPPAVARRVALRQESRAKFEIVASRIGADCRVFIAWHDGRPVAGCITLVHGAHAIGWRSYSIKELAAPVAANTAAQVAGLEDACRSGCRWFDFGQSGGVGNLQSFKHSLGATPRAVVDLRIEPPALTAGRELAGRAKESAVRLVARARAARSGGTPDRLHA